MEIIALMFVVLTLSFLLGELFRKFKMPKVLGPIIVGLVFANFEIFHLLNDPVAFQLFDFFKDLGIIFLLFFVGLKIDLRDFKKTSKRSILVGVFASLIPFVCGFLLVMVLSHFGFFNNFITDSSILFLVAFVVGVCMSITAEGVIIEILEELNLIKSIIGETVIESGIIDDIVGILLISGLVAFLPGSYSYLPSTSSSGVLLVIGFKIFQMMVFGGIIFLLGYFVVPRIMKMVEKEHSTVSFFSVSIMLTLFLVLLTQYFDLGGSILGALFAGIIIRHTLLAGDKFERREEKYITDIIEVTTFGFFAPFFFIWIGLNVEISIFLKVPVLVLIFVAVAIVGKMVGSVLGNKLAKGKKREGIIIGWGMNTRSGVDVMITTLALTSGLITVNLFSLLIFMSFATTVISPIIFEKMVRNHHGL